MPRRERQRVEVVAGRLDLATVDDRVAEPEEDVLDLAPDLRDRVQVTAFPAPTGSVTSTRSLREPPVEIGAGELSSRASNAASRRSRTAFSAIPVSRSRTSRSACLSALFRPRYSTRAAWTSSVDDAAATAARASASSACASMGTRGYQRPRLRHCQAHGTSVGLNAGMADREIAVLSLYDPIARIYDPWSRSVVEDIEFYVEEALAPGGPVVELAVGTGRVAVPIAEAGVRVIGVDLSEGMLEVAGEYARERGVANLVDLRAGDLREPPVRSASRS